MPPECVTYPLQPDEKHYYAMLVAASNATSETEAVKAAKAHLLRDKAAVCAFLSSRRAHVPADDAAGATASPAGAAGAASAPSTGEAAAAPTWAGAVAPSASGEGTPPAGEGFEQDYSALENFGTPDDDPMDGGFAMSLLARAASELQLTPSGSS